MEGIFEIFKIISIIIFVIVCFLGCLEIMDYVIGEEVPQIMNIGFCEEAKMAYKKANNWRSFSDDPEQNWQNLQPSVKILRKVCPEAAKWVIDRHDKGLIIWETKNNGCFANYNYFSEILSLNESFLMNNDGQKACTLAHEFRHSRQNITKPLKLSMWLMILGHKRTELVENEAYWFGDRVHIAIFD